MGLVDDTEYYVYAFSCTDGNATSPLSKAAFKTGKFIPSEECTFEITTTVERQDVTVNVVPSNRNVTYYFSVTRAAQQEQFDADLQFAVDDLIWTKIWAESQQITLSSRFRRVRTAIKWTRPLGRDGLYRLRLRRFGGRGDHDASDPRPLRDEGYDRSDEREKRRRERHGRQGFPPLAVPDVLKTETPQEISCGVLRFCGFRRVNSRKSPPAIRSEWDRGFSGS